jgi:hypothetical protein
VTTVDPWASASANVLGCALAWRARALFAGAQKPDVDGEDAITDLVTRAARIAKEAYDALGQGPDPDCKCGRCYEVAILVALSVQWSTVSGQPKGEVLTEAVGELDRYMKGRS